MTRTRLRQLAEDYVGRFGGPSSNLRRVLQRHLDKEAFARRDEDLDVMRHWQQEWQREIHDLVATFTAAGALDDARYAQHAARVWVDRGLAPRAVAFRLQQKGIASADIGDAIAELGEAAQVEWQAALHLARRRRLGPYRPAEDRSARRHKDAAALARAGFSAAIAFKVVDLDLDSLAPA